jgi:transcriptional regulator with XRE-family HTH domain
VVSLKSSELLRIEFARSLRAARAAALPPDGGSREMTQEELAHIIGVSRSQISNWETGKDSPPAREVVRRMEAALGVTDYDLLLNAGYHPLPWPDLEIDQKAQVKVFLRQLTQTAGS